MKYIILMTLVISQAWAQSFKDFQIIARANNYETYSLPAPSFINNITPQINNLGDISFHTISYYDENPTHGIFYKGAVEELGKIVYSAPNQRYVSDPSMSDNGNIVFNQYDDGQNDGIFQFNSKTLSTKNIVSPKLMGLESFARARVNENNDLVFRARNDKGERLLILKRNNEDAHVLARHGKKIDNDLVSYLFEPSFKGNYIVSKVRFGERRRWEESRPDLLVKWNINSSKKEKVFDRDYNKSSDYKSFHNSLSVSENGSMVFISTDDTRKSSIFLQNNNSVRKLVQDGEHNISQIENFSVAINNFDEIAFRAIKTNGRRAIFYIKNNKVKELVSEGDFLSSDQETARIITKKGFPGFSGGININDNGQIVFHCLLESKNGERAMGSAIYIARME